MISNVRFAPLNVFLNRNIEGGLITDLSTRLYWDIPVKIDGEEDRNSRHNNDEISFWADYVTARKNDYIYDELFRLIGDLDPALLPVGYPRSDHRLFYVDKDKDVVAEDRDNNLKTVTNIEFLGEVSFATGLILEQPVTVNNIEFIGEGNIATGTLFQDTEVGGISGLTYDATSDTYYALSDDRGNRNDPRFYTVDIDLSDGSLDQGDVEFQEAKTLLDFTGEAFELGTIDPEGIALANDGTLFISSEGDANNSIPPFVKQFSLDGQVFDRLPIPRKFRPRANGNRGIRNNQAFESLTITPDNRFLYTATENALIQDGEKSSLEEGSPVRILKFDLETRKAVGEFLYFTDPIPVTPDPVDGFADNGLVELLAIDNTGTFLALERSFAVGVGNNIRLYEVNLQGATDISGVRRLTRRNGELKDVDAVVEKRLILDFSDLGIILDNSEAVSFGETLPDGRQSIIVTSDNNFNDAQKTQFLAFAIDTKTIPAITPTTETPPEIRFGSPDNPDPNNAPDADDPAIYVHPDNSEESFVITTFKNGGLRVYDLEGKELQSITPEDIRYNNVDIAYDVNYSGRIIGGEIKIDFAVVSDRANDTLAFFSIDPETKRLSKWKEGFEFPESIFGIDDGEATAYGLATYTSLVDGKNYVFVSQADGNKIAQIEFNPTFGAGDEPIVNAKVVRIIEVPVPEGEEPEDFQVEGMVVDRETGYLYVGQEEFGIWKYNAEPKDNMAPLLVDSVEGDNITADVEGLTIYYGEDGNGYLLASSQGNNTFAIYDRAGSNSYLGSFAVEGVEESDGADIINVPLGDSYPAGLLVVQDGSNTPQVVFPDPEDGEIQNFNTNFKYVSLADFADIFPNLPKYDPNAFDPRNPQARTLVNGLASGDTTQDSTVLWARSTVLGDITFEYSTDSNFNTILGTINTQVIDTTLPIKVEVIGLEAATDYYYRVTDAAGDSEIGEFTTSTEMGTNLGLRFGVAGDWRGELAPYPAISNVPERELAFFVEHGDTIYADDGSDAVLNPDGTQKSQVETIEEYRAKHSEVYSHRLGYNVWADLRASTSILATIDDHEVTNDFAGGADASTDSRFPETEGLINDTQLFETGLQAFQEYNPLRDEFYGETGDEVTAGERKLYRYNTYGSDAASFILDTRSFRDEGLTPASDITNPEEIGRVLTESITLDRTLLGKAQLENLKQDLVTADKAGITWKFIMVPEPAQNLFPGINVDSYEGYLNERAEILSFIEDNDIDNVVFVAADVHMTSVNNLTYQTEPLGEQIATSVFEITTGAVAYDPPTGEFLANFFTATNPELQALYDSLPIAPDPDNIPNDKDDLVKQAINDTLLTPLGFDPIGLDSNLPQAEGLIDAELLQGDYYVGHSYSWTEFDIDADTQQLRVTTYGVDSYSEAEILANPNAINDLTPIVLSEFVVNPTIEEPEALDILLVNDDGFEAEGIDVIYEGLVAAGYDVTLVAPKAQQSGKGTLINVESIFQPVEVVEFEENKWFVDGSPIVTTLAGLDFILDGEEPDLVISGINEGANIGANIAISSGTVSAATTATRRGIPAIAISANGDAQNLSESYEVGTELVLDLIEELQATQAPGAELLPEGVGLSVNIPENRSGGVALTELDQTSNINLSFGELPEGFGEGAGVLFSFNEPISPDEINDPTSEGENFLAGNITITPIDGSWVADSSIRESIQSRFLAEIALTKVTPLNILLTNDDGFEAEGIKTIYNALTAAGHNVILVAPEAQQSGTGTALDVDAILQPTEVVNFQENKWYVDSGVRTTTWAGLDFILEETPDLVISGINEGENIGAGGAVSSGTVSAAVTAILRDVPAIAVSAGIDLTDPERTATGVAYEEGSEFITQLIAQLQATQGDSETILPEGIGLSVNIPVRFPQGVESIQGVAFTEPDGIEPFIIDFGEVEGGAGLRFAPFQLTDGITIAPLSEGGKFLSGFITVTAIDGNWTANSEQVAAIGDRIDSLLLPPEVSEETIFGTLNDDIIKINGSNNLVLAGIGDDTVNLFASGGNNTVYGGVGYDIFQPSTEFPDTIADFELGGDVIGIAGASFEDLTITADGNNVVIGLAGKDIAFLVGVNANDLTVDSFAFS
ncbi:MAG: phytase [Xenococcaceae cyanobacterium MO_167.B52]|nr:phytase [Xenococcaceae cyanobacterium MO_167.B52]